MNALVWAATVALAVGSPLDDLVHALQGWHGKTDTAPRGALPDLRSMRHDLHSDRYGRLSTLSPEDLVQALQALGYSDAAVDGKAVAVIIDEPGSSITVKGQVLHGKALFTVRPVHQSLEMTVCIGTDMGSAAKLTFANGWNERKRFSQAFADDDGGLCLHADLFFTKYDKANLEALDKCVGVFVVSFKEFFAMLRGFSKMLASDRRLTTASLDELVRHVQSSRESVGGELPDLGAMLSQIKSDSAGRLADPSRDDVVHMLKALGFHDAAADDSGNAATIFLDDRLNQATVHGHTVDDKAVADVVPADNTLTVVACFDANNHESLPAKLQMVNRWNAKRRFSQAYWHEHHGVCLQIDAYFTKYNKANLQLLQKVMSLYALQMPMFHANWVAATLHARRLQFV